MMSRFEPIFKFWLPKKLPKRSNDIVRLTLFIKVIITISVVGVICGIIPILFSENPELRFDILYSPLVGITILLIIKYTGNGILAFNVGALGGLVALGLPVYNTGGIYSSTLQWILIFPVAAYFIVSKNNGLIWTIIAIVFIFSFFILDLIGIDAPINQIDSPYRRVADIGFLTAYVGFVLFVYEKNRMTMLSKMVKTHNDLEKKNLSLIELNREKETLMAIVAHDLRSPQNQLLSIFKLMEMEMKSKGLPTDYISVGKNILNNSLSMINDITYAKEVTSGLVIERKENLHPQLLLEEVCESFKAAAEEKKLDIITDIESLDIPIFVDKTILNRILHNFISNAIKFSPFNKRIFVSLFSKNDQIIFSVKDEGPGIAKEEQKLLFRPFQKLSPRPTNKEHSSGLGLYIVKMLAKRLHSQIEVISDEGKGAEFRLIFPLVKEEIIE